MALSRQFLREPVLKPKNLELVIYLKLVPVSLISQYFFQNINSYKLMLYQSIKLILNKITTGLSGRPDIHCFPKMHIEFGPEFLKALFPMD
jgi:hypothetical protein